VDGIEGLKRPIAPDGKSPQFSGPPRDEFMTLDKGHGRLIRPQRIDRLFYLGWEHAARLL